MTIKRFHEIRDPVAVFVKLDTAEREVLNSAPVQRLRHIHQLALTYLVYPGATHRRFEHSLGVMHLASRVFDVITDEDNRHDDCRDIFPNDDGLRYWRRVLRMAALCHDIGHMPFSHAAEVLLPENKSHEDMTLALIKGPEMEQLWDSLTPPLKSEHIAKLALGPKELPSVSFTSWEALLSEIITGNAFGVDRIDYLLRDSLHAGVAYGKFDHYRLIDTLRILPTAGDQTTESTLGVEAGGLHSAEALILARHFMFTQLYCHPVRRIYDIHLKEFLLAVLPGGKYSIDLASYLQTTDAEITVEIRKAAMDEKHPGHLPAKRICSRQHFRLLYERMPDDIGINLEAVKMVYEATCAEFGTENVRHDHYSKDAGIIDFPVLTAMNGIVSAWSLSKIIPTIPSIIVDTVYISLELKDKANRWLAENKAKIIQKVGKEEE
jgi:hypothetical protein